jgi:hypothetical protein
VVVAVVLALGSAMASVGGDSGLHPIKYSPVACEVNFFSIVCTKCVT